MKKKLFLCIMTVFLAVTVFCPQGFAIDVSPLLIEMEKAVTDISNTVGDAVVSISTQRTTRVRSYMRGSGDDLFEEFFREFLYGETPYRYRKQLGLGSGVIIDPKGYILTNEHVISGAEVIVVTLADGRKFNAVLKGSDYRSDLAIIKIEAENLPFAKLGDSDTVQAGQWAIAIGNPFGFVTQNPKPTVTFGVISALHRTLPSTATRGRAYLDLIQTDAAINPGNSGGPLTNIKGEIIGINVAIFSAGGGSDGIGFAIPINDAKSILSKLLKGEEILYGWLGIGVQDLNAVLADYFQLSKPEGVLILKVFANSPAEKAGLKNEDIIIKFNDQDIKNTLDFLKLVRKTQTGERIKIKVVRNGLPRTLSVEMGVIPQKQDMVVTTSIAPKNPLQRPKIKVKPEESQESAEAEQENPEFVVWRGLKVSQLDEQIADAFENDDYRGVIVNDVQANSPAERSGIKVNDIITQINTHKVSSVKAFQAIVSQISGNVLVKTNRGYLMIQD
jgi:serine protease Do